MANIQIQFSGQSYSDSAAAVAAGVTNPVGLWVDLDLQGSNSAQLEVNDQLYATDDVNDPWTSGDGNWYSYDYDGLTHAAQIDANGVVLAVTVTTTLLDTDGDGTPDVDDTDDDNDGYSDADEIAAGSDPLDANSIPTTLLDTDGDGTPDVDDTDDDNDGYSDADEIAAGSDPLDASSVPTTNAPPSAQNGSVQVANDNTIVIDLANLVTDSDSAASDLTFSVPVISAINGELFDPTLPNTPLSAGDSISGTQVLYDPNDNFVGSAQFTYSVTDALSGVSVNAVVDITVMAPSNMAPIAQDLTYGQSADQTFTWAFQRLAQDDYTPSADLVFEWCDSTGQQILTLAQLNATLQYGQVNFIAGETFQYASNTTLQPDATSSLSEVFYFKVTDNETPPLSDVGIITVNLDIPGNNPPILQYPPIVGVNESVNQYSTYSSINPVVATDSDGDVITYSVEVVSGQGSASLNNTNNLIYNPGAFTGTAVVQVTATDPYGGSDTGTFTFTVGQSTVRQFYYSTWSNSSNSACGLDRLSVGYYKIEQATNIGELAVGDNLYQNIGVTDLIIPQGDTWVSIQEDNGGEVTVRAARIDGLGNIEEIVNCVLTGGLAWPTEVWYTNTANAWCRAYNNGNIDSDGYETGIVYQNIAEGTDLSGVVTSSGQLFNSEFYANEYAGVTAPLELIVPNGIYIDPNNPGEYYDLQDGVWTGPYQCAPPIEYSTRSLDVRVLPANLLSVSAVCNASTEDLETVTIYYRLNVELADLDLVSLMRSNILIYSSADGANNRDYSQLSNSAVIIDANQKLFCIWDNEDSTGFLDDTPEDQIGDNAGWYGFTVDNILEPARLESELGVCDSTTHLDIDYAAPPRPSIAQDSSDKVLNVYYLFWSCRGKLDKNAVGSVESMEPFWNLYVLDGFHTNQRDSESYMKDFIDFMLESPNQTPYINTPIGCVQYLTSVEAINLQEANAIVKEQLVDGDIRVANLNPVDLGFGSNRLINFGYLSCTECLFNEGNPTGYQFPVLQDYEVVNRKEPNFDLETNYKLDNVSKPLLRTNPKLSGNVKLLTDSTGNVYLESFNSNKELASIQYKKFRINPNGDYSKDLARFFNRTPSDIIFAAKSRYSDLAVQESFDKQIEEDYHYGTTSNESKLYNENLRILAPMWVDKNLPKKFVIFRVNDPVGELDFDQQSNLDNIQSLLKNSEIIKTFDLTKKSELGRYLRRHVESEAFPLSPITFNFGKNEKSTFNGIDLAKGGFTKKGEYLYTDFVRQDNPLISSNRMITDGFERNKLACANLINFEFLFDDPGADNYTVNRYFGLYVDDIDSGYGSLKSANEGFVKFENLNSYINEDGSSAIPPSKLIIETPTLGYLSISEDYYKLSSKKTYASKDLEVFVEDSTNNIPTEIKLAWNGQSIDIVKNDNAGFDFVKVQVKDVPAVNDKFSIFKSNESAYSIKFLRYQAGETFYWAIGTESLRQSGSTVLQATVEETAALLASQINNANLRVDVDSDLNTIYITEIKSSLEDIMVEFDNPTAVTLAKVSRIQSSNNIDEGTFFATYQLDPGTFKATSFSNQGSLLDISKAITACINANQSDFVAIHVPGESYFYVRSILKGYKLLQSGLLVPRLNSMDFLEVENPDVNELLNLDADVVYANNHVHYMNGGNSAGKSVLVTEDSVAFIHVGDYLETRSKNVYNKVIDIVEDITNPGGGYKKLVLEEVNTLESGEVQVYADNVARLGLFSVYDIHDLDFDFHDETNSKLRELNYETPELINYEPNRSPDNTLETFSEDYGLSPADYFTGISDVLPEETADKYNEIKLTSEFDRLQENSLKEFATESRVVPVINKWVLKDTVNVRENPYFLNANEAFGRTNFAPDVAAEGRDRLGMTHEWFYMDQLPKYFGYDNVNDSFSYLNFIDGFELTPAHFKSVGYNYFDRFMITEGFELTDDTILSEIKTFIKTNREKKYSLVNGGNDVSFASTIFKGLKVLFKNRKEFENSKPTDFKKTSEFNGYKFSTVVKVKTAQTNNDISYEIIQNKKFKFVVFFITVSLDDLWTNGSLNRKLLYELNHAQLWDGETKSFRYANVSLSGALDLKSANLTDPTGPNYLSVFGVRHYNQSYPQFVEQINADDDDQFSSIKVTYQSYFGPLSITLPIGAVEGQNEVKIKLPEDQVELDNFMEALGNLDLDNMPEWVQRTATYTYEDGGQNAYSYIMDSLSIANIYDLLRNNSGEIKYVTVDIDGAELDNRFQLEFEPGKEVIKESYLLTDIDIDKPKSFKLFSGVIGYNLERGDTYYPFLVRHNGEYTVSTKPVVTFTDVYTHFKVNTQHYTGNLAERAFEETLYKHSLNNLEEINLARDYYRRYNRCGVAFNLGFINDGGAHDAEWGVIKNHYFRKVNESNIDGITKLSTSTDKLPLYPLIGETAIDKKDVNVFKSSWDKNYYTRSLSGGKSELVPGTLETKEERSYLGSTIMKLESAYTLTDFTVQSVETQEEQDDILINSTNEADLVLFEDDDKVYIDFYMTTIIRKTLKSAGVLSTIEKFVSTANSAGDKTTLEDDVEFYVNKNLMAMLNLDSLKLFTKRIKGEATSIETTDSVDGLDSGGFIDDNNFTFRTHQQKPLNFRLIYNKRLGYSYRIRPMVKIKS